MAKAFTTSASTMSWPVLEAVGSAVDADPALIRRLWTRDGVPTAPAAPSMPRSVLPTRGPTTTLVVWCGLLLTGGVAIAVMQAVDRNVAHTTFVTDLVQTGFAAVATAAFGWRAWQFRATGDRRSTVFFTALAGGTLAWTAGQVAWFAPATSATSPFRPGISTTSAIC
ncbi:hypothetical protein [Williamsia maris]|uniref:hypothetical protein n=1 Tax=Williamsia maris TaxID=72806 RepID=UPI0020A50824|nr:hypothetical protein [Williamsia maris]